MDHAMKMDHPMAMDHPMNDYPAAMAALFCTGLRQDRMKELSGEGRRNEPPEWRL